LLEPLFVRVGFRQLTARYSFSGNLDTRLSSCSFHHPMTRRSMILIGLSLRQDHSGGKDLRYESDLTDEEFALMAPFLPEERSVSRKDETHGTERDNARHRH
jgi:hypothetical protein